MLANIDMTIAAIAIHVDFFDDSIESLMLTFRIVMIIYDQLSGTNSNNI
jgi:hypothetical protein